MKTTAYTMAVLVVSAAAAGAQTPAPGEAKGALAPSATHLHLSAKGTIAELPDVLVGDLTVEATSPSAVTAQRKVNEMMLQGMKEARANEGIEARAMGYSVNQIDLDEGACPMRSHPRRMGWTAQQTLESGARTGSVCCRSWASCRTRGWPCPPWSGSSHRSWAARPMTERWSKHCRRCACVPTRRRRLSV